MSSSAPTSGSPPEPASRAGFTPWLTATRRRLARLFREHTSLSLTVIYLLLTLVGAVHEFFLYMRFRVNILQFADAQDFLLAAIRQPLVVVFCVLPLALLWLLELSDRWSRRFPWYARMSFRDQTRRERYQSWIYPVFILVYFTWFTLQLADFGAKRLRAGEGRRVAVRLTDPAAPLLEGTLVGTTSKYVIVYQAPDTSTHVIPIESMVEMRMLRRAHGRKRGLGAE